MKTVSVATLKSRLSHFLQKVEKGEIFVVTSHKQSVALLSPVLPSGMLKVIPPLLPMSFLKKIKGVYPRKMIDPVSLLMEDRNKR